MPQDSAQPLDADPRSAVGMFLAEYGSLREESKQAREAQMQILHWSLVGLLLAVTAGGLTDIPSTNPGATIYLLLYAVGIPGLALAGLLVYLGELYRMERAAFYIRGLEREVAEAGILSPGGLGPPLRWESFIASRYASNELGRKQLAGYVGGGGIYVGSVIASFTLASIQALSSRGLIGEWWALNLRWVLLAVGVGLAAIVYLLLRGLFRFHKKTPDLRRLSVPD